MSQSRRTSRRPGTTSFSMQVTAASAKSYGVGRARLRMVASRIEDGKSADEIGCVRNFQIVSGATVREKLLAFSDTDHSVSYSIIETPQPISNHKATLTLRKVTDGDRTFAEWSASFDAPAEEADKIAEGMAANVFQGGFNALKSHFAENP